MKKNMAVILGDNLNCYGIVRSLGEKGINSIVIDKNIGIAGHSKYTEFHEFSSDSETDLLKYIIDILSKLSTGDVRIVMFATSDYYVDFLAKYQDDFKPYASPIISNKKTVELCNNKELTMEHAEKVDVAFPKTICLDNARELPSIDGKLLYPVLIKPAITVGFVSVYKKAIICNNLSEILKTSEEIIEHGLENCSLLVQEFIPGSNEQIVNCSFFCDKNHEIKAVSIGYKIRQYPPETGTMIAGRVVHIPEVLEETKKFIKNLDYYGIGCIEFKYDSRDGKYKLMELNPRTDLWNYSSTAAGVNMPYLAIADLEGQDLPLSIAKRNVVWIYDSLDLIRSVVTNRKKFPKSKISYFQWRNSIKGEKHMAIRNYKDIKPWLFFLKKTFLR